MLIRRLVLTVVTTLLACAPTQVEVVDVTEAPSPASAGFPTPDHPQPAETTPIERQVFDGLDAYRPSEGLTLVAMASGEVPVFDTRAAAEPAKMIPATTILGTSTVLKVVEGPIDGWAKVLLPGRPNGSHGWVELKEMSLFVVEGRLVVDLSERSLTLYQNDRVILETPVAIGTERNPTPIGSFFVTDRVTLSDPSSPWGPYALGLSARSETITEYNGGDGIIGIHGTNRPGSIGQAASLGCIRLPNDVITVLHELVAVGTPVEIVA